MTATLLMVGASGFVGQQLRRCGLMPQALGIGRKPLTGENYIQVPAYDEASLRPHFAQAQTVVWLPAITRGRQDRALHAANVQLPDQALGWLRHCNAAARFIFVSSDLAGCPASPYGRSKLAAEKALQAVGGDVLSLRLSAVAGYPDLAIPSSLGRMKALAGRTIIPIMGTGRFTIRPLHVDDLAQVLLGFHRQRGRPEDRRVFDVFGEPLSYRQALDLCRPAPSLYLPVPLTLLSITGKALLRLRPNAAFPLDFIEMVRGRPPAPNVDAFAHLGLQRLPVQDVLGRL